MQNSLAYLFPAFTTKFTGKETALLNSANVNIRKKLKISEKLLDLEISNFNILHNNYLNDELKNQIIAFNFSASFSDILKKQNPQPACLSGFSMGLYAALYHSGAIAFETGLQLIFDVYQQLKSIMSSLDYGMFSVIGFSRNDLEVFVSQTETTEIVIENGEFSFVMSGANKELLPLIGKLNEEGAVHLNTFNVSVPYHSKILLPYKNSFKQIANNYKVTTPQIPLVSMIDNSFIDTAEKAQNEITNNIIYPLNFMANIKFMHRLGIDRFVEIGAGTSLLKSSKFISGNFNFISIAKQKLVIYDF